MSTGLDNDKIKSLDEAINFNQDNLFEYLYYLLGHCNASWYDSNADEAVDRIHTMLKNIPEIKDIFLDLDDLIVRALVDTSEYAYKSGFKEACRLIKTLNSF